MMGWDAPKEPAQTQRSTSLKVGSPGGLGSVGSPKTSGGGAPVQFNDGAKAGWWAASDNGILNEADAANDKSTKGFAAQTVTGGTQQYGSIFGARPASIDAASPAAAVGAAAPAAATPSVGEAAAGVVSAVGTLVAAIAELDPFAELLKTGGAAAPATVPQSPATAGSPAAGAGGIEFADGKKSGWWAAGDNGILNEADAVDDTKGAKKAFVAQHNNNYGSMLNWKPEEAAAPAAAAAAAPAGGAAKGDWDPFQAAPK